MKAGITGHQHLGSPEIIAWIRDSIISTINQLHVDIGVTSLAIGADQLYAAVLKDMSIPYLAIIPCDGYESTFTNIDDLKKYQSLLQGSSQVMQLPFDTPSEAAFFEAGKRMVNSSDTVIAIWDGQPAQGLGGTGDIVRYAHTLKRNVVHINPITQTINSIGSV